MRKLDREEILNRWAAGEELAQIGAAVGTLYDVTINSIVCEARRRGDPRAKRRGKSGLYKIHNSLITAQRRQRRLARLPVSFAQIAAAINAYGGSITQCPPGFHAGHRPSCLRAVGL